MSEWYRENFLLLKVFLQCWLDTIIACAHLVARNRSVLVHLKESWIFLCQDTLGLPTLLSSSQIFKLHSLIGTFTLLVQWKSVVLGFLYKMMSTILFWIKIWNEGCLKLTFREWLKYYCSAIPIYFRIRNIYRLTFFLQFFEWWLKLHYYWMLWPRLFYWKFLFTAP